jgi:hypothetical protein
MITAASLKAQKSKELAQQAKQRGVSGWHSMKKDDLVKALLKVARNEQRRKASQTSKTKSAASTATSKTKVKSSARGRKESVSSAIALKLKRDRQRKENLKNLALAAEMSKKTEAPSKDRVVMVVRDAYWLQAYWEITRASVQRARVALGNDWHLAKPVVRVMTVFNGGNAISVETPQEDIEIHGGVNNWYFSNPAPGKTLRLAIGYIVDGGKFHLIAKSNQVVTATASGSQSDENWTDITNDVERYFALSGGFDDKTVSAELQNVMEEKSQQSVYTPAFERLGSALNISSERFDFQVDAHLVVHGTTLPGASVSVAGQPVQIQADGTFAVRVDLAERRQVLPVVAANRNGTQQRTTVLAIERNTKVMDPVSTDIENS